MWNKPSKPSCQGDNEIIPLFLVHCSKDLMMLMGDGRVINSSPVEKGIFPWCFISHNSWTPKTHHSVEMLKKVGRGMWLYFLEYGRKIPMGSHIIPSQVSHDKRHIEVVMKKTSCASFYSLKRDLGLFSPLRIWFFQPGKVIVLIILNHLSHVLNKWMFYVVGRYLWWDQSNRFWTGKESLAQILLFV